MQLFRRVLSASRCIRRHPSPPRTTARPMSQSAPMSAPITSPEKATPKNNSNNDDPISYLPRSLPALFCRGGTSNGLVIWKHHLPPVAEWPNVLPALMGSPDPYGRQLDGMGSGISSTSKICVLAPSADPALADVDFTFVQVGVKDGCLDMAGNCGNMLSVVGPVALTRDLYWRRHVDVDPATGLRTVLVRILNTNTSKVVHARFRVEDGSNGALEFSPKGSYVLDGVSGTASRVDLSFISPGGAKTGRTLPTGNPIDTLALPDGTTIEASLVDVSNPGVFVRVSDLGIPNLETLDPPTVEADGPLKARLEQIRQSGASRMGLDPKTQSVPKIVLIFPPDIAQRSPGVDIKCLALSMGQAHKAVPLTLGLCLGAAVRLPGTIPNQLAAAIGTRETVIIGHPGGKLEVGTKMENGQIISADLYRTARVLMKGEVFY